MYKEITSFEQAVALHPDKDQLQTLPDLSSLPSKFSKGMMALLMLQVIAFVVNNDDPAVPEWKADFNDEDQYKYYPWYTGGSADGTGSGFSFGATGYVWARTHATGGARLALKDEERAEHMNEHFQDLYKDLWLILQ